VRQVKNDSARGLPAHISIPIVLLSGAAFLAVVIYFLRIGFGVEGAALGPTAASPAGPGSRVSRVPSAAGGLPGTSVGGGGPAAQSAPPPQIAAALARLRATLQRDPRNRDALVELAGLELEAGRFSQAQSLYARTLAVRADDPPAQTGEARAFAGLGERARARALLARVLAKHPNFTPALQAKAQLSEATP
jgi:hypothetical protein